MPGVSLNYELSPNINTIIGFHKGFSPPGPGSNQSDNVKPEDQDVVVGPFVIRDK